MALLFFLLDQALLCLARLRLIQVILSLTSQALSDITDNPADMTGIAEQKFTVSTSAYPASQTTNNQQLPQTGNKNSALLGLGLSALTVMLGIGSKRLKQD